MKILKRLGIGLLVLLVLAAVAYPFRRDPIGPIAGRALTGERMSFTPDDWRFTEKHMTIAVEVRPDDPHSVTTVCFVHDGALHIPAMNGSTKEWPQMVVEDPRIAIKIDGRVFPALAHRVLDPDVEPYRESIGKKYEQFADRSQPMPEDVWVFRLDPVRGL